MDQPSPDSSRTDRATGPGREVSHGAGFVEVGDRCWVARYEFVDVNVGVVAGERGLLVVDTHASEADARRVIEDLRRVSNAPVVSVVNTHAHFDHFLGNAAFRDAYDDVEILAHEDAAAQMEAAAHEVVRRCEEEPDDPHGRDIRASRVRLPDQTFSSARVVDLGDRLVEVIHPGRGHTAGDAVVRVPDAEVLYLGDLVEESGTPGFGDDCFPFEWPATLDLLIGMLGDASVVVPGHGVPVRRDFVEHQRGSVGVVAETIRELVGRGVAAEDMGTATEWPYPAEQLGHAFARGRETLPRSARTLPLA